eukprot:COSAG04_NODE_13450_length_605_cov_37.966403_1_plen_131_part_10
MFIPNLFPSLALDSSTGEKTDAHAVQHRREFSSQMNAPSRRSMASQWALHHRGRGRFVAQENRYPSPASSSAATAGGRRSQRCHGQAAPGSEPTHDAAQKQATSRGRPSWAQGGRCRALAGGIAGAAAGGG